MTNPPKREQDDRQRRDQRLPDDDDISIDEPAQRPSPGQQKDKERDPNRQNPDPQRPGRSPQHG